MTNETGEKYKIELSWSEIREIQYLIFKRIEYGCNSVGEARDYIKIYDKLEKHSKENSVYGQLHIGVTSPKQ